MQSLSAATCWNGVLQSLAMKTCIRLWPIMLRPHVLVYQHKMLLARLLQDRQERGASSIAIHDVGIMLQPSVGYIIPPCTGRAAGCGALTGWHLTLSSSLTELVTSFRET